MCSKRRREIMLEQAKKLWEKEYASHSHSEELMKIDDTFFVYSDRTLYESVRRSAERYPKKVAIDFLDAKITYKKLIEHIDKCADILERDGIKAGDAVSIALPNIPNAIIAFYAISRLGAKASMIHPLSSPSEVENFLKQSKSVALFTLDMLYPRLMPNVKQTGVKHTYISKIQDYLPPVKAAALAIANHKKPKTKGGSLGVTMWDEILKSGDANKEYVKKSTEKDVAAILYSGGTSSGTPKGILLSSYNFEVLGKNVLKAIPEFTFDARILTILPLFHGFGLGICVNAFISNGAGIILVPQFSSDGFIDAIKKKHPEFIAGVPSMYSALMANKRSASIDYSFVKGAFCGGDVVPPELKKRFDKFMGEHNGNVTLREGYGLTECVTACAISTSRGNPHESLGIPIPGTLMKVVEPNTQKEVEDGTLGEICVATEALMMGYLDAPEETAKTLQVHEDGRLWLHTGDMGYLDENGFFYFKQRIKRIVKVSGFPVYPSAIEAVVAELPFVQDCAAIGRPDDRSGQHIRIYVVPTSDNTISEAAMKAKITAYCKEKLNKWSMPREILFRNELPLTRVGKINIPALEEEANNENRSFK